MNASKVKTLPVWLASVVCLPLLLGMSPSKAEAAPPLPAVSFAAAVNAVPSKTSAPDTVHVVLNRGRARLELDLPRDGKVSAAVATDIARMMRDPNSGREKKIASGTLALLADLASRFPGHEIDIVSAVRAEPERSRDGIKHSKHWDGHAIDLSVRDVNLAQVRDTMWKNHRDIGVGWYPEGRFIHLDYRPDVHDTAWTQPRKNADNIYHPRWSEKARDPNNDFLVFRADMKRAFKTLAASLGFAATHVRSNS